MARAEGTDAVAISVKKMRPARVLFVALGVILLYFILFPYPLGRERVARAAWAVQLPALGKGTSLEDSTTSDGSAPASFSLGDRFGYVEPDGRLLHIEKVLFRVALSDAGFINYTRLGTDWIMYDPHGKRLLSVSGSGYPLLSPDGGRLFNVATDLSGIIELDAEGETLWSREFPGMMTSVSVHGDSLLVGLLNGTLLLLNREGSVVFEHSPAGSRVPVILGDAISVDSSLIACVSGIDPQYCTVFRRHGSTYVAVSKTLLASDFRREVRMTFAPDSRLLVLEGERSAGILDAARRVQSLLPLSGALAGVSFPGHGLCTALVAHDGSRGDLQIVAPFSAPVLRESFAARELSVGTVGGQLLLGIDGQLVRIDIEAL